MNQMTYTEAAQHLSVYDNCLSFLFTVIGGSRAPWKYADEFFFVPAVDSTAVKNKSFSQLRVLRIWNLGAISRKHLRQQDDDKNLFETRVGGGYIDKDLHTSLKQVVDSDFVCYWAF